jgi:DNA-binding transcriptional MocR family regulator
MKSWEYQDSVLGSSLSANAKLTALAIAYHYNWEEARQSFPSIAKLVQRTSLSRASIYRAKNELVSQGYLVSTRRFNDSNLYLPQIPSPSQTETLGVSQGRTNYEYNYEVNNEYTPSPSYEVLGSDNIIDLNQEEIWRVFEDEKRTTRPQPAGRGNRKPGKGNRNIRRNNQDITAVAGSSEGSYQEAAYRMGGEW